MRPFGALLLACALGACRDHELEDGAYALHETRVLRDDCALAQVDGGVALTGTLHTEGHQVAFTLDQPDLRLVGTYLSSVERATLDGSLSNYQAVLNGRTCLLDVVTWHLDTTTTSPTSFTGAVSVSYQARQPDECGCTLWMEVAGARR